MRKSYKTLIASVIACTLVGALAFNGTLAYLTDTEGAANVVTVGKVQIDLEEPGYPGNNSDEVKRVIPNQEIVKDPQVENTGNNAALIYLKVDIPQENFTEMSLDGTLGEKKMQDLFALKGLDGDWELIKTEPSTNADTQKTKTTYVYAYRKPLEKGATTSKLFDKVQMKNAIENDLSGNVEDIVITACAIQATDIPGEDLTVGGDGYLNTTTLNNVYTIFVNQSGDKDVRPADKGDRTQTGKLGTITYNLGDDASLNDALYEYGSADYGYAPPTPVKEGYTFAGWTPESIPADSTGNISFTAKWEAGTATLLSGSTLTTKMSNIAGTKTEITAFLHSDTKPTDENMTETNVISKRDSETPIYLWRDGTTLKWWSKAGTVNAGADLNSLFRNYKSLTDISGLADWNTSSVTNMYGMFNECSGLTNLNALENWNTGSVEYMSYMLYNCNKLTDLSGLENWNTGSVKYMSYMFYNCNKLTDLSGLENWDTGTATDMSYMFDNCSCLTNLNALENWDTGSVTNMSYMFKECYGFTDLSGLSNWNTGSVTNMSSMFDECSRLTNLNALENWDTGSVTDMSYMFGNCDFANLSGLSNWDTRSVTNMYGMFHLCDKITNLSGLENWNTGSVKSMSYMFRQCSKLIDASAINDWDITKVTGFTEMFYRCPSHPNFTKRAGTWSGGTFIPTT